MVEKETLSFLAFLGNMEIKRAKNREYSYPVIYPKVISNGDKDKLKELSGQIVTIKIIPILKIFPLNPESKIQLKL